MSINQNSSLINVPFILTNIKRLYISDTAIEDVRASIRLCFRRERLTLCYNEKLKEITHLPKSLIELDLSYSDIEKTPDWIKDLDRQRTLNLSGCKRLTSLPELPDSLKSLMAESCESLETVFLPRSIYAPRFHHLLQIERTSPTSGYPARVSWRVGYVTRKRSTCRVRHRARGNSLKIPHSAFSGIKVCLVISRNHQINNEYISLRILCRCIGECYLDSFEQMFSICVSNYQREHLFIFHTGLPNVYPSEVSTGVVLEFSSLSHNFYIIECGAQTFSGKTIKFSSHHSFTNWRNELQPA